MFLLVEQLIASAIPALPPASRPSGVSRVHRTERVVCTSPRRYRQVEVRWMSPDWCGLNIYASRCRNCMETDGQPQKSGTGYFGKALRASFKIPIDTDDTEHSKSTWQQPHYQMAFYIILYKPILCKPEYQKQDFSEFLHYLVIVMEEAYSAVTPCQMARTHRYLKIAIGSDHLRNTSSTPFSLIVVERQRTPHFTDRLWR